MLVEFVLTECVIGCIDRRVVLCCVVLCCVV